MSEMEQIQERNENSGEESSENRGNKPQLNVKLNGSFVGRGWMQEGKYGKYFSLAVNQDVPAGSRLLVAPNKYNNGLLG